MKLFTHPEGIFEIKVPFEWYYKNEIAGYKNESPFSFELYNDSCGCFQLSAYHKSEKTINPNIPRHKYDTNNLQFVNSQLPDEEFEIYLWATVVEDYFFMAKYVCQPNDFNRSQIKSEVKKVNESLATLMCLSKERRSLAVGLDRFDKFMMSLGASFDLKNDALVNKCFIQLIIVTANQIDAYLRVCIVLCYQLKEETNFFRIEYLFQKEEDKPLMEKKIYDVSKEMGIVNEEQHKELYRLYNLRNKVVHRYIITDIKTIELPEICLEYEKMCEEIRIILQNIEDEQFNKQIGYYSSKYSVNRFKDNTIDAVKSLINEKHLHDNYYRK